MNFCYINYCISEYKYFTINIEREGAFVVIKNLTTDERVCLLTIIRGQYEKIF